MPARKSKVTQVRFVGELKHWKKADISHTKVLSYELIWSTLYIYIISKNLIYYIRIYYIYLMINRYNPFIPSYIFFIFCFKLRTLFRILKGLLNLPPWSKKTHFAAESPSGSCSSKRSFTLWATVFENQALFLLRYSACIFGAQNEKPCHLVFFFHVSLQVIFWVKKQH